MTTAQFDYPARVRAAGAAYVPITVFNGRDRVLIWTFRAVNLTTATFRGEVRARPDAGGAPLASWSFVPALVNGDTVVTGTLAKADILALPAGAEPGSASLLYSDFTIEPDGGIEQTFMAGELYRAGSVTA